MKKLKVRIGDTGFEFKDGNHLYVKSIIEGHICSLERYDVEGNGVIRQDLVVNIRNDNDIDLILKYTSLEAREIMNILANLNANNVDCGKNCKLFFLSDINENGAKYTNLRLEKDGKHIRWFYQQKEIPEPEKTDYGSDFTARDLFWDSVYKDVKGIWCDL